MDFLIALCMFYNSFLYYVSVWLSVLVFLVNIILRILLHLYLFCFSIKLVLMRTEGVYIFAFKSVFASALQVYLANS